MMGRMRTSPGMRVRCSIAAVLAAAGLAACSSDDSDDGGAASSSASGSAASSSAAEEPTYLALGDSVPFGYIGNDPDGYADQNAFVGYPDLVGEDEGFTVVSTTCPGETTASFLDEAAESNGCTNRRGEGPGYRDAYPLHVDYQGAQMDEAVRVLQDTDDVELVTLQIGANDGFICADTPGCATVEGITAVAQTVQTNVDTILAEVRDRGGYDGQILVVQYYATDYSDALTTFALGKINDALAAAAQAHDADVVSGFDAFRPAAEAAGGSSIAAGLVYPHDVHPTPQGQRLLADAVEQAIDD